MLCLLFSLLSSLPPRNVAQPTILWQHHHSKRIPAGSRRQGASSKPFGLPHHSSDIPLHDLHVVDVTQTTSFQASFFIGQPSTAGKPVDAQVFIAPANASFTPGAEGNWQPLQDATCVVTATGTTSEGAEVSINAPFPVGFNLNKFWIAVQRTDISSDDNTSEISVVASQYPNNRIAPGSQIRFGIVRSRPKRSTKYTDDVIPITLVRPYWGAAPEQEDHTIYTNQPVSGSPKFDMYYLTKHENSPWVGSNWMPADDKVVDPPNGSNPRQHDIHFERPGGAFAAHYMVGIQGMTTGNYADKEWSGVIRPSD